MMGAWMIYAAAVAMLVSLAAVAAEPLLRSRGRPGRWTWAAATAASIAIPLVGLARSSAGPAAVAPQPLPGSAAAGGLTAGTGFADILRDLLGAAGSRVPLEALAPWLLPAWLIASAALGLALACGLLRLASRARGWPTARVDGTEVLLSEDVGPAVVGVRRPKVVVPRWMLGLDAARLRLAVWHEEAHRTAGDAQLLLAGAVAVVLAPWNPALWWQLRRLRAAVELDCDGRVLARGAPRHAYGSLLLDVGAGGLRPPLPIAALFGHKSALERRLTMIGKGTPRRGRLATAALAATAVLGVALACETQPPTEPTAETPGVETTAQLPRTLHGVLDRVLTDGEDSAQPRRIIQEIEGVDGSLTWFVVERSASEPIIYVDGVRIEGPAFLNEIEPDAIERVEVIKGAAAERLFGQEAAAGVIQIFRKRDSARGTIPRE